MSVAYATGKHDITFPIASKTALGCIKVGENLTITEDGTLNAQAGGGITSVLGVMCRISLYFPQ